MKVAHKIPSLGLASTLLSFSLHFSWISFNEADEERNSFIDEVHGDHNQWLSLDIFFLNGSI